MKLFKNIFTVLALIAAQQTYAATITIVAADELQSSYERLQSKFHGSQQLPTGGTLSSGGTLSWFTPPSMPIERRRQLSGDIKFTFGQPIEVPSDVAKFMVKNTLGWKDVVDKGTYTLRDAGYAYLVNRK